MKKLKYGLSILVVFAIICSNISFGMTAAIKSTQDETFSPFSSAEFRRPSPAVTLDATDVIRVGAAGDTAMGSGTTIKKATPSGVPFITGTYASQAYAGETPEWPTIIFGSSQAVNITSVTVTGGSAVLTLSAGNTSGTTFAKWEIRSGTASAGNVLKISVNYTYTWLNQYTGVNVIDTYTTAAFAYVENIIFPAGVWAFTSAYSSVSNAADVQYVSRILGRGVYGSAIGREANSNNDYSAGYFSFSANSHIDDADITIPKKTMLISDPPHSGAYDQYVANGTGSYSSGDADRTKTIVYLDTSVQTLQTNNFRMHFFIHGTSRSSDSNRDLTYETINVRDGDVSYTGDSGNVLGTSSTGALAALNPSGPVDGTVSTGGLFITAGMETQSTLFGTGAAGNYTLITQWTGRGDKPGTGTPNWMQYYHAVTVEIIRITKGALRNALNTAIGTTTKAVTGSNAVTTIVTSNAADPENGGIQNIGKGKNPQSWYYNNGWSAYNSAYEAAWMNMNKPNAAQAPVNSASTDLSSAYSSLSLLNANYTDNTSDSLLPGLGNTLFGSAVSPLNTLVNAVSNADSSFNVNLKDWKAETYNYYTPASRLSLETAYALAVECQLTAYNVLYQPYVDYCAKQLQDAVDNLTYNQYRLTFDGNGSTSGYIDEIIILPGTDLIIPANTFINIGSTFLGWSTIKDGPVVYTDGSGLKVGTDNISLYAKWSANNYTIIFDSNGGEGGISKTMQYGELLNPPEVAKTGHLLINWEPSLPLTVPAEDATYVAQWAPLGYNIEFNANGGSGGTIKTLTYGTELTPPTVVRFGYMFMGWSPEVPESVPAENAVYTAIWEPENYIITFNANSGTGGTSSSMAYGTPLAPPVVSKTGYTLTGWLPSLPSTVPAGNITYTAQWSVNNYTVVFNANGGSGGTGTSLPYGSTLRAPSVTRPGYTFAGWEPTVPETVQAENVTYTASWIPNKTIITFNAAGGIGGITVELDFEAPLIPPTVTKDGYDFTGWLPFVPATVPAQDTVYTAQWTVKNYLMVFDSNGGTGGTSTYINFGDNLIPPTVVRAGYVFAGWLPEVPSTVPSENKVFTAQWIIDSVVVSFDLNGGIGTVPAQQADSPGAAVTLPEQGDITRQYYTFVGWADSPSATEPTVNYTIPSSNRVLYAVWVRNPVSLNAAAGSSTILDNNHGYIYGLQPGMDEISFIQNSVLVNGEGELVFTYFDGSFGTGTKVELVDKVTENVLAAYYIVIFGDADGNGLINAADESTIKLIASYQNTFVPGSAFEFAADLNRDGFVDAFDLNLIRAANRSVFTIDQTGQA